MTAVGTELLIQYQHIRRDTERICHPLQTEDYVVQPVMDVSPPKWHIGHTSWFFETFILIPHLKGYKCFDPSYDFIFNSYYESVGERVLRAERGNLTRPSVEEVYRYRRHVDDAMQVLFDSEIAPEVQDLITLGLNHEQQHQELLYTDIKYILGHNPLFPAYDEEDIKIVDPSSKPEFITINEGVYEIGFPGPGFCFDNELQRHKVYLNTYSISNALVTNKEYMEFMEDGGYNDSRHWHSDGWEWVKATDAQAPLYWRIINGFWKYYTLHGCTDIEKKQPVTHINFYEASAFAAWKGMRLPTEAEWEVAAPQLNWGRRWEWTNSAYLPYPGYKKAEGAIGEYNGKFMVNQMVLRGASVATPRGHSRISYRNFFNPHLQWQFSGIRLAQ